jgi:hypothetical protein
MISALTLRVNHGSVELVWNKGIAALCDRRIPDEFPDGRKYSSVPKLAGAFSSRRLPDDLISNPSAYADVRDGDLIWVRLSWLKSFVRQVLPIVQSKFVLVTADSDSCVPSEVRDEARTILGSRKVLHWYTQNHDGSMPSERISPIPIGIDFHSQSERPLWGESISLPAEQEGALYAIRDKLPPMADRIPKVYIDFAWQSGPSLLHGLRSPALRHRFFHPLTGAKCRETRRKVAYRLRDNQNVYFQPGPLPRREMWRKRGEYAFVLSPHGVGLDCHRTWEALALGHIILIPSSSLNPLYDGLPVGTLNSWSDITSENLHRWLLTYRNRDALDEKTRSDYWVAKMRTVAGEGTASA